MQEFDLIIIGGGVVGLTIAALLKESDLSIAIIDRASAPAKEKNFFDLQQRALNLSAKKLYDELGVWAVLNPGVYSHMHVWDENSAGVLDFSASDIDEDNLGFIVSYRELHLALYEQVKKQANVTLFFDEQPEKYWSLIEGGKIKLQSGKHLTGRIIVGADGRRSWLREQAGIEVQSHDYQQQAIVMNVETEQPHEHVARQRFLTTGPLAFLPLENKNQCALVWSCDNDKALQLMALTEEEFEIELTRAFESKLGKVTLLTRRVAFPLIRQHANHYQQNDIVLAGDAAHVIHPLAGLGLNLGVADAKNLADEFLKTKNIVKYEQQRRAHNIMVQQVCEQLGGGFANNKAFLGKFRELGIGLVQNNARLKQIFTKNAAFFSS